MSDETNVLSKTQIIVVEPTSGSVAVINSGPAGPPGPEGAPGPAGADGADGAPGPGGSGWLTYQAVSANTTAVPGKIYFFDTSSADLVLTLPAGVAGDVVGIVNNTPASTHKVTVSRTGTDQVDHINTNSYTIRGRASVFLQFDGTSWNIIGGRRNHPTQVGTLQAFNQGALVVGDRTTRWHAYWGGTGDTPVGIVIDAIACHCRVAPATTNPQWALKKQSKATGAITTVQSFLGMAVGQFAGQAVGYDKHITVDEVLFAECTQADDGTMRDFCLSFSYRFDL